jgi:hypothetical protein
MVETTTLTKEDFSVGAVVVDAAGRYGRMVSPIDEDGLIAVRFADGSTESLRWEGMLTIPDRAQVMMSDGGFAFAANLADG